MTMDKSTYHNIHGVYASGLDCRCNHFHHFAVTQVHVEVCRGWELDLPIENAHCRGASQRVSSIMLYSLLRITIQRPNIWAFVLFRSGEYRYIKINGNLQASTFVGPMTEMPARGSASSGRPTNKHVRRGYPWFRGCSNEGSFVGRIGHQRSMHLLSGRKPPLAALRLRY